MYEVFEINYNHNGIFPVLYWYTPFIFTFYLHYFVIIPRLIKKPNFFSILKWFVVFFIIFAIRRTVTNYFALDFLGPMGLIETPKGATFLSEIWNIWEGIIFGVIMNSTGILGVALGCRYIKNKSDLKELERQKIDNELSALKNQIDIPETINILSKLEKRAKSNPSSIQDEIIQLSSVLRYHLYSKETDILLFKELDVVQNQLTLYNELNNATLSIESGIDDRLVKTGILSKAIGEVLKDTQKVNSGFVLSGVANNTFLKISDSSKEILNDLEARLNTIFSNQINIQTTSKSILIQLN